MYRPIIIFTMFTVNTYIVVFQLSLNKFLENLKTQETVVFDEITLNEGNAYNKTSGIFTTPSDGLYSFTLTLSKGGKLFITEIVKNGHPISYDYKDGRGRD